MNDRDQNNLNFILGLKSESEWEAWAESVDEDDVLYALELVRTQISMLETEKMSLEEEIQNEDGLDCSQALEIINRVKKGVSQ